MASPNEPMRYEPRYHWRMTWADKGNDRACYDGERCIGRIYKTSRDAEGNTWFWTMLTHGPDITRSPDMSGYAADPFEAARMVEEVWGRVKPQT